MKKPTQAGSSALLLVLTVPEACEMFCKPRNTILYAIDAGNLCARKSGATWLVSLQSLIEWFGWPKQKA